MLVENDKLALSIFRLKEEKTRKFEGKIIVTIKQLHGTIKRDYKITRKKAHMFGNTCNSR